MKAGLDPALTLKVIADGGGSSRMLQVRGPMMVSGDYSSPTMKLDVWQKDMNAIADFAKEVGCPTPLFATTAPIYLAAMAAGRGAEDTGASVPCSKKWRAATAHRLHGGAKERRDRVRRSRACRDIFDLPLLAYAFRVVDWRAPIAYCPPTAI